MPPVNPYDEPIDIVSRPVNPDGSVGSPEPESAPRPDTTEVAFPGGRDDRSNGGAEVRYWRFQGTGDDGCGCGGCGCLTAILLLLGLMLLQRCASFIFQ